METWFVTIGNFQVEVEAKSAEEAKNAGICLANKKNPLLVRNHGVMVLRKNLLTRLT